MSIIQVPSAAELENNQQSLPAHSPPALTAAAELLRQQRESDAAARDQVRQRELARYVEILRQAEPGEGDAAELATLMGEFDISEREAQQDAAAIVDFLKSSALAQLRDELSAALRTQNTAIAELSQRHAQEKQAALDELERAKGNLSNATAANQRLPELKRMFPRIFDEDELKLRGE